MADTGRGRNRYTIELSQTKEQHVVSAQAVESWLPDFDDDLAVTGTHPLALLPAG